MTKAEIVAALRVEFQIDLDSLQADIDDDAPDRDNSTVSGFKIMRTALKKVRGRLDYHLSQGGTKAQILAAIVGEIQGEFSKYQAYIDDPVLDYTRDDYRAYQSVLTGMQRRLERYGNM